MPTATKATIYSKHGITRLGNETNDDSEYDDDDKIPLAQLKSKLPVQTVLSVSPVQQNWFKLN